MLNSKSWWYSILIVYVQLSIYHRVGQLTRENSLSVLVAIPLFNLAGICCLLRYCADIWMRFSPVLFVSSFVCFTDKTPFVNMLL